MCSFSGKWRPAPVARWICWSGKQWLREHRAREKTKQQAEQRRREGERVLCVCSLVTCECQSRVTCPIKAKQPQIWQIFWSLRICGLLADELYSIQALNEPALLGLCSLIQVWQTESQLFMHVWFSSLLCCSSNSSWSSLRRLIPSSTGLVHQRCKMDWWTCFSLSTRSVEKGQYTVSWSPSYQGCVHCFHFFNKIFYSLNVIFHVSDCIVVVLSWLKSMPHSAHCTCWIST